jgi:ABC-type oligopeptide transport system ATPase subunit
MPPSPEIQGHWAKNGGLFPFLASSTQDPYTRIAHVSFRQRSGAHSGAFFDYTSRYGAPREETDRVTLRATFCPSSEKLTSVQCLLLEKLVEDMGLSSLMDLPINSLSNGQTRRARIAKAILAQPELLLLDEPLGSCLFHSSLP